MRSNRIQRYRGCLLGLAIGDALGTTLEFQRPGAFTPITDLMGGGPFGLAPGQWTDDTSMALCLAESLIERKGFNPRDQLARYVRWWREGHLSSTGRCFDIGSTVEASLRRFEKTGAEFCGSTDPYSAGNGSLMRLAPVVLFYSRNARSAIEYAAQSSRTTHSAIEAVDACRYLAALLVGALSETPKETMLSPMFEPEPAIWEEAPLAPRILEVAGGSFKVRQPPEIRGSGYVVQSLEAALWAFHQSRSFQEALLLAVNLGDDADTTGAICGQLAGAFYGEDGIPLEWRQKLHQRRLIEDFAEKLYQSV